MKKGYMIEAVYRDEPFIHEIDLNDLAQEKLVEQLLQGQYSTGPITRVLLFDPVSLHVEDVSATIAEALDRLSLKERSTLPSTVKGLVNDHGLTGFVPPYDDSLVTDGIRYLPRRAA